MNILDDLKNKVALKKDIVIEGYDFTITKLPIDVVLDVSNGNGKLSGEQMKNVVLHGVVSPDLSLENIESIFIAKIGVGIKLVEEILSFTTEGTDIIKKK